MKIIDLLNLVYEKKAPKKIKYCDYTFELIKNTYYLIGNSGHTLQDLFEIINCLNDEVEIIEDKPKKIEKIKMNGSEFYSEYIDSWIEKSKYDAYGEYLSNKLNEAIDRVNYLLEKSKDNEI